MLIYNHFFFLLCFQSQSSRSIMLEFTGRTNLLLFFDDSETCSDETSIFCYYYSGFSGYLMSSSSPIGFYKGLLCFYYIFKFYMFVVSPEHSYYFA
jgi:hypothetical protein